MLDTKVLSGMATATLLGLAATTGSASAVPDAAPPAASAVHNPCEYRAERAAVVALDGATRIVVEVGSGSLEVEGRADVRDVRVSGVACASEEDLLDEVRVEVTRRGDDILVEAVHPEDGLFDWGEGETSLDLVIYVPEGLAAEIDDGSGSIELSALGDVRVEDGSGSITGRDIRGALDVDDGSGDVTIQRATGSVTIEDGSGPIRLTDIEGAISINDGSGDIAIEVARGAVRIRDGSGGIEVRRAARDVIIEDDGSGSIDVHEVGGDFIVRDDGSGGISHERVQGRVSVPVD